MFRIKIVFWQLYFARHWVFLGYLIISESVINSCAVKQEKWNINIRTENIAHELPSCSSHLLFIRRHCHRTAPSVHEILWEVVTYDFCVCGATTSMLLQLLQPQVSTGISSRSTCNDACGHVLYVDTHSISPSHWPANNCEALLLTAHIPAWPASAFSPETDLREFQTRSPPLHHPSSSWKTVVENYFFVHKTTPVERLN